MLVSERHGFSLALALNELASSALRHGFPGDREGQVAASIMAEADRIEIVVADDGIPAAERGADVREEVLGPQSVVRALVETELGGRITEDPAPQGTRVRITCPIGGDGPPEGDGD